MANAEASGDLGAEAAWEEEVERRIHKIEAGLEQDAPWAMCLTLNRQLPNHQPVPAELRRGLGWHFGT